MVSRPQRTRDHNAFGGQLSCELDGLVALLSQRLEPASDGRDEGLSEITRLGRVGLFHLIEQQSPRLIFRFDLPFLALRQLERFGRVVQPLASNRATYLFKSTMYPVDLALYTFQI